jgi:hypothetical protein
MIGPIVQPPPFRLEGRTEAVVRVLGTGGWIASRYRRIDQINHWIKQFGAERKMADHHTVLVGG